MKPTSSKLNRSHFSESISLISAMHSARYARLDFWGPVVMVCMIGAGAHFVHAVVVTLFY